MNEWPDYPHKESCLDTCAWCGEHRGIDHLELAGRVQFDDGRVELVAPNRGDPVALVSHCSCGPSVGYPISLPDLLKRPDFWMDHLLCKPWFVGEFQDALEYLTSRPLPLDVGMPTPSQTYRGIHTYFIQSESGGPIKIGKSQNPTSRLQALQTAHHQTLRLIKVFQGDREEELHLQFAKYRIRGEWFSLSPEMEEYLRQ